MRELLAIALVRCALVATVAMCALTILRAAEPIKPPSALLEARRAFKERADKAQAEYDRALSRLVDEQKRKLKDLQKLETKAGNFNGAIAIRDDLKSLDDPGVAGAATKPSKPAAKEKETWVPGAWVITYQPGKFVRVYGVNAQGEVTFSEAKKKAQLRPNGDSYILDFGDGKVERLTFAGSRMFVEHFNPKSAFEKNQPDQVGVGGLQK